MIGADQLTPRQRRIGRRAARFPELRPAYLMINGFLLVVGGALTLRGYQLLAQDPARGWQEIASGAPMFAGSVIALSLSPTFDLLARLYRGLEGTGSLGRADDAPPLPAAAREGLAPAEVRLVTSARQLERLGWGAIRGALLALLVSSLAVIAAAVWRFGGATDGLGTAALAMAASGGLTLGVTLGGFALLRWMRLAARFGAPAAPGNGAEARR